MPLRYRGITWGNKDYAIVTENWRKDRRIDPDFNQSGNRQSGEANR